LGRYRFESVHPEEMAVECSGMNWWSELKEIDVSPGETTHMPIVASKTCTIRGRVTVDGKPPGKPIVVRAYRYVAEQNRLTPKEEYGLGRASMGSMLAIGATEADGTFTFVGLRRDQSPNDRIILDPARPQIADGKSIQFGWLDSAWQSEAAENRNKPWPWIVAVDPDRPAFAECNLSTVK
jgi:hypothetical protein